MSFQGFLFLIRKIDWSLMLYLKLFRFVRLNVFLFGCKLLLWCNFFRDERLK